MHQPDTMAGMNVVLFITDQDRALQHFPPGWAERNLPGLTRLQRHGVTFNHAFTNSCMCSPARATLMTGYFPAQHGVKYTLELDMPAEDGYPQVVMPLDYANLASVMSEVLEGAGLNSDDVDWVVPHQANARILEATARKLGLPAEKVVVTVDRHANTSAASVPLAFDTAVKDGRIKRGDVIVLEAMGGGFTWGAAALRY